MTSNADEMERRLRAAFAGVTATSVVDSWRSRVGTSTRNARIRPRLLAVALTAGIAAALLVVSVAGTIALSHFHAAPQATAPPSVAPATTATASPVPATQCSRAATTTALYGFRFDSPGTANPTISCSQAITTLHCPPPPVSGGSCVASGVGPITAELVRVSTVTKMNEVRANGDVFVAGPPLVAGGLLVWRLTFEPTVCTVDSTGISGSDLPPFSVFFTTVSTRCRQADDYLIDASTGDFVVYDDTR